MADISLKIRSDFDQAERDIKNLEGLSESARKEIEQFTAGFDPKQIENFTDKNRKAAAGVEVTQGKFKAMQAEAKGLEKEIRRLVKNGLHPNSEEVQKLQKEYQTLSGRIDEKKKQTQQSRKATQQQTSTFRDGIKTLAKYAAAYVSLRAAIGFTRQLTTALAAKGDELAKTSRTLGITVEDFQGYEFAAKRSGVSTDQLKKAFEDMNKNIGQAAAGQGRLNTLLNKTNPQLIEQVKNAGDSAKRFDMLVDEMQRLEDTSERAAFAQAAFGGAGREVLRMAEDGSAGIAELRKEFEKYGNVMSQEAAEAAERFTDAQENLRNVLAGITLQIGSKLLGPLATAMQGFADWASDSDNLANALKTIGAVLAGVTSAVIAYAIGSGAAAVAAGGLTKAILAKAVAVKALTVALLANPLFWIAAVIGGVVFAIVKMIQHWDLVKFKVVDFVMTANIKMLELRQAIISKVMGSLEKLFGMLARIPGGIGDSFQQAANEARNLTNAGQDSLRQARAAQQAHRAAYEEQKKESEKAEQQKRQEVATHEEANKAIVESDKARVDAQKMGLESILMSEQAASRQRIEEAQRFFQERSELEAFTFEERLEWMREQHELLHEVEFESHEARLEAEKGLREAILEEERKMANARLQFAGQVLKDAGELGNNLNQIMANVGKESRAIAIITRTLAVAEATIASLLAYTRTLAAFAGFGPGAAKAAASITLAAGMAKAGAIATQPLPSAQTGLDSYTVPDVRGAKNDRAAVMASPGEEVSITPRGEASERDMQVNIMLEEDTLISVFQKFIDTGKLTINDRNVGNSRFAS